MMTKEILSKYLNGEISDYEFESKDLNEGKIYTSMTEEEFDALKKENGYVDAIDFMNNLLQKGINYG